MAESYRCPQCLELIGKDEVVYRTRDLQPAVKPRVVYDRTPRRWLRAVWDGDPDPLYQISPKLQAERDRDGVHARCPQNHPIPEHALRIPSYVVGLLGERSAGKTVYVGTLLEWLAAGRMLPFLGFSIEDDQSRRLQAELFGAFYRDGIPPQATLPTRDELHRGAITLAARSSGEDRFYLSFFDASGENRDLADHGRENPFLYHADVVLHLITPEALGLARRSAYRRQDQLQSAHETFEAISIATRTAQRKTHAAVVISKSDDIDPDALPILRDARADLDYRAGLSLPDAFRTIDDDSHIVRTTLRSTPNGLALAEQIEGSYRSVSYHLVSATGAPPAEQYGRFLDRRPQRVLDPLLASLVAIGAVDVPRGRTAFRWNRAS